MTAIVALRYLLASGGFALATQWVRPGLYAGQGRQIRMEIGYSLLSAAIYGVPAGVVAWGWQHLGWTRIYTDFHAFPLWYLPVSLLLYLFAHDTWFYWTHRLMHRPHWFRVAHAVHHASRPPTAWAAMSFHPIEALTGAVVIPALVFFIPVHVGILGLVLMIMTVMGVTNHMGWEMFPRSLVHSRLGGWLITASHHERHHEHYQCNYGLYFRVWDRLCRTDRGLAAAAVFLIGTSVAPPDVSVTVTGLRNAKGQVMACLTAEPRAFPNCKDDPAAHRLIVPAATGGVELDFGAVVPGRYALSLFHDENSNGKLDTVMLIPREGYGFSRDAAVRFGPPKFAAAAFTVDGTAQRQTVRMRYMF